MEKASDPAHSFAENSLPAGEEVGGNNRFVPGVPQDLTKRWDSSHRGAREHAKAKVSSRLLGRVLALPRGSRGRPDHVALGAAGNSPE